MSVKTVNTEELRSMSSTEGLVLQGCGGELKEWIDGINGLFKRSGILLEDSEFKEDDCYTFKNGDLTCLLFPFSDDISIDLGKMAMWRLQTHQDLGGTWFSDYVDNRLGGFIKENDSPEEKAKPDCALIGEDGNIFNLMGIASRTLKENGMANEAKEMCERVRSSGSYYEALGVIGEYVNITSSEDMTEDESEGIALQ
ncbi:MAG: hypothetical protein J6A49_07175 [Clostridia bacterium]|nr:hypothetical protein [Clostridia bacterium]